MVAKDVVETIGRLGQRLLGTAQEYRADRRHSLRAALRIPIQVRVGDAAPRATRLHDISPSGLCLDGSLGADPGDPLWVRFEGYPGVCESFVLTAEVVRSVDALPRRVAARISRDRTRPEALEQYRLLVLHYLRHKPLLGEKGESLIEGRCRTCGWIGRVSTRKPFCSRCGMRVAAVIS